MSRALATDLLQVHVLRGEAKIPTVVSFCRFASWSEVKPELGRALMIARRPDGQQHRVAAKDQRSANLAGGRRAP